MPQSKPACFAWLAALCVLALPGAAYAVEEKYDYDALGRLIRVIGGNGQAIEYSYDVAGNLIEVSRPGTPTPPSVTTVVPNKVYQGATRDILVTGKAFAGSRLTEPVVDGLSVTGKFLKATELGFKLSSDINTVPGSYLFGIVNSIGTAEFTIQIEAGKLTVEPSVIAIPPDGVARQIRLRAANPEVGNHNISLVIDGTTIAQVSPGTVALAPGQAEAVVGIVGLNEGVATLSVTSPTLGGAKVAVSVTTVYAALNSRYAPLLGVTVAQTTPQRNEALYTGVLGVAVQQPLPQRSEPLYSASVGVAVQQTVPQRNELYYSGLVGVSVQQAVPQRNESFYSGLLGVAVAQETVPQRNESFYSSLLGVTVAQPTAQRNEMFYSQLLGITVGP